jgi:ParB family chromosome partitioning protein
MEKKALGKGLGALFEGTAGVAPATRTTEIELHRIIPNRYQPRRDFDEEGLDELTESVRRSGVLQPVVVRRIEDGQYELVVGERRWRAAQKAGLARIPAVVKEATDAELLELALTENLQRQDLNPIEAARAYRRLVSEFHQTQEEVALRVGKDRSSVANLLRLLSLPPEIQEEVTAGRLTMGHARALLALGHPGDQVRAARQVLKRGLSVRQTEWWVKRLRKTAPKRVSTRRPPGMTEMEEKLKRHLATPVRIISKAKGGTITIQYYNLEDLDRISELILS